MAIYLTESFHLNSNQPFDVRAVVGSQSYYLTKDDILYRYPGLRVWDFSAGGDGLPFVWTGATWSSENSVGATIANNVGNLNYIAKFFNDSTILTRSLIYDNNTHIGIGLTAGDISPGSLITGLHVKGNIKTNNNFIGDGSQITQINASNITTGLLSLDRIAVKSPFVVNTKYFLNLINNAITWNELNTDPFISLETSSSSEHYINFTSLSSGQDNINASTSLKYIPSKEQILNGIGGNNYPSYSFNGNDTKGIYLDVGSNELSFKVSTDSLVSVNGLGLTIRHTDYPQIAFRNNTNSRLLWVNNANALLFREDTNNASTDKRVWHESNLYHLKQVNTDNKLETLRNSNGITLNYNNTSIGGIYSYNLVNDTTVMQPSLSSLFPTIANKHKYWSNIVIGNGANGGSFQIAGNWYGASASDREMLVRSLDQSTTNWSEWSRVCLNESQSFKWSMGKTQSTRDMLKIWMENNNPKFIITSFFDTGGNYTNTNSGNGFNIPYSPSVPATTTTGAYDRYGVRSIMAQARHNIRGYDIYYGINSSAADNGIYFCMFKNPTFNSATMREWTLLDAVSANIIWTPASLGSGGGGHYSSPIIAPVTLGLNGTLDTYISNKQNQAYPNGSATYGGFSALRVHHDEDGNSVFQNTQIALHLQPRFIQEAPI